MIKYLGYEMQQQPGVIDAFNKLLQSNPPGIIIELGTGKGGLAVFLSLWSKISKVSFVTFDNLPIDPVVNNILYSLGTTFVYSDIFSSPIIGYIKKLIENNNNVLLLCDNGDKTIEFNLFVEFL